MIMMLFQLFDKEVGYTVHQMIACVAAEDAVIAVGIYLHVELYACLYQCFTVFGAVLVVHVVVGLRVSEGAGRHAGFGARKCCRTGIVTVAVFLGVRMKRSVYSVS